MIKCNGCNKDKQRSWLFPGIITGFVLGFLYFAIGVYTHSPSRNHQSSATMNSEYDRAGTTR